MTKILTLALLLSLAATAAMAQPKMRRNQAQESQQKTQNGALTTRAEISFPTSAVMDEDVVWRRDIYRELDLMDNANAGLYYPGAPTDGKMTSFEARQGLFSCVLCLYGVPCFLSVALTSYCDACRALWAACLRPLCLGL